MQCSLIDGESSSEEESGSTPTGEVGERSEGASTTDTVRTNVDTDRSSAVRERSNKRKGCAKGVPISKRRRSDLIEHVGARAHHMETIAESLSHSNSCPEASLSDANRSEIVKIVREELKPTNDMISSTNTMISDIKMTLEEMAAKKGA